MDTNALPRLKFSSALPQDLAIRTLRARLGNRPDAQEVAAQRCPSRDEGVEMIDSNTRESIVESLRSWDRSAAARRTAEAEQLRVQFVERFPLTAWPQLPLEDYALGQNVQDTVSWWLEYKPEPIGSIKGGSAHKHLIFRAKDGSWRFPVEYESVDRAWGAIREGFVEMLNLASSGKFDDADDIKVLTSASAVRTKLLYMYFPATSFRCRPKPILTTSCARSEKRHRHPRSYAPTGSCLPRSRDPRAGRTAEPRTRLLPLPLEQSPTVTARREDRTG